MQIQPNSAAIVRASLKTQIAKAGRSDSLSLNPEFQRALTAKLESWLGKPGSANRARIERAVEHLLTKPDATGARHIDLDGLPLDMRAKLKKLEKAAQDFEAIFVKQMLSQMRQSSFSEEIGPMGDMAKDMMDQAIAESASQGRNSIGIARTVFLSMAQNVARSVDPAKTGTNTRTEIKA